MSVDGGRQKMEEAILRTMLFDFYSELLTEKQRRYYHLHYNEDLSLSEIAEAEGISRQGVWDIIRRAEEALRQKEAKIGLLARYELQRRTVSELSGRVQELLPLTEGRARELTEEIDRGIRELQNGI